MFFFLCTVCRRLLRTFLRIKICQDPLIFAILFWWTLRYVHRREPHPCYMGSFLDLWVGIPEFAGDMKLIFICFGLLTHVVLLLCSRHFWVHFDLLGGCQTEWGPPDVLRPSPGAIPFFSTPRSIFKTHVQFLVTKFPFLELGPTGPVLRFDRIRNHPISVAVALVGSVSLHDHSVWRFQSFSYAVFSKKFYYFW